MRREREFVVFRFLRENGGGERGAERENTVYKTIIFVISSIR